MLDSAWWAVFKSPLDYKQTHPAQVEEHNS